MPASPWADGGLIVSPNGKLVATITDATEIAMGAPTSGELRISNGLTRASCNPSAVWSSDSEYLAVPQWTSDRRQRLMVISMSRGTSAYAPGAYRVLELHTFDGGVVEGVDSPVHQPRAVRVDVGELEW